MNRKFHSDIERIFFESTILDIDFSNYRNYIALIVLSRWMEWDGVIFPMNEAHLVKFFGVTDIRVLFREKEVGVAGEDHLPGIETNDISIEKSGTNSLATIGTSDFKEIRFIYSHHSTVPLSERATMFSKLVQAKETSFMRPDLERISKAFFKGKR